MDSVFMPQEEVRKKFTNHVGKLTSQGSQQLQEAAIKVCSCLLSFCPLYFRCITAQMVLYFIFISVRMQFPLRRQVDINQCRNGMWQTYWDRALSTMQQLLTSASQVSCEVNTTIQSCTCIWSSNIISISINFCLCYLSNLSCFAIFHCNKMTSWRRTHSPQSAFSIPLM